MKFSKLISRPLTRRVLLFSLCLIGCGYQLISVTWNFFSFKVRNEISYEYPKSIAIPDIDIVIPISSLMNITELYLKYPEILVFNCYFLGLEKTTMIRNVRDFNKHCSWMNQASLISTFTLSEVWSIGDIETLTEDPRFMVKGIFADNNLNDDLIKSGNCKMSRYLSGICIFVRISCRKNSKPIVKKVERNHLGNDWVIIAALTIDKIFGFRFNAPGNTIESRLGQYVFLNPEPGKFRLVNARFNQFITKSLPYPYETNCKNYDVTKTLIDCINKRLLSIRPPKLFIDTVVPFGSQNSDIKFANKIDGDRERCAKLTVSPECNSTIYRITARVSSELLTKNSLNTSILLALQFPLDMDTYYNAHPATSVTEYLIFSSSILGIWFGISIYGRLAGNNKNHSSSPIKVNTRSKDNHKKNLNDKKGQLSRLKKEMKHVSSITNSDRIFSALPYATVYSYNLPVNT